MESLNRADEPRILEYRNQVKIAAGFLKYLSAALFIFSIVLIVMSFFSIEKNKDLLFGGGVSIGILCLIFLLRVPVFTQATCHLKVSRV